MARALRAWAINRGGKNSVRNLRYGPRTRLVRGIYTPCLIQVFHSAYEVFFGSILYTQSRLDRAVSKDPNREAKTFCATTEAFNFPQHPVTVLSTTAQLEINISDSSSMTIVTYQTDAKSKFSV